MNLAGGKGEFGIGTGCRQREVFYKNPDLKKPKKLSYASFLNLHLTLKVFLTISKVAFRLKIEKYRNFMSQKASF